MSTKVGSPRQIRYVGDVDKSGRVRISREAERFIYDVWRRTGGDVDAVSAAQTTATTASATANSALTAAESAEGALVYVEGDPSQIFAWRSDPSGVFPASDPTRELTLIFYDKDGTEIARRTMTGTLDSSAGTITVANTSSSGLTTTYSLSGDGSDSVKADIAVTLDSGSKWGSTLAWNAIDTSVAGGTPASGGGK